MASIRQDSWSSDDDRILATIIIEYIRTGKTQLEAFEFAGEQLTRTPAACGFRWNSFLRKQYTDAISDAKTLRFELRGKQHSPNFRSKNNIDYEAKIDEVIRFLVQMKQSINDLKSENSELRAKTSSSKGSITNDEVQKMFLILQKVVKNHETEKEMPAG